LNRRGVDASEQFELALRHSENAKAYFFSTGVGLLLTPAMVHGLGGTHYGMRARFGSRLEIQVFWIRECAPPYFDIAYFRGENQRIALDQIFAPGILGRQLCDIYLCDSVGTGLIFTRQMLAPITQAATFSDILLGVLLLIPLKMGFKIISFPLGIFLMAIVFHVLRWFLAMCADAELEISVDHLKWQRRREMFNFGFYSFANNSGETHRYYTDSFVIGRMHTVGMVTRFNVVTRLIEYVTNMIGGVAGPGMVKLTRLRPFERNFCEPPDPVGERLGTSWFLKRDLSAPAIHLGLTINCTWRLISLGIAWVCD
jgi:hypothetical protein